ncbi:MAG: GNAT family N-acetyltransferase [Candidatus Binataceae bacterium]
MVRMYQGAYRYTNAVLSDGRRVLIRPLCPNDADGLAWYFRGLSPATAYQRFHGFRRELSPTELGRMTNPDFIAHAGLVATLRRTGGHESQIVAEGHYLTNCASRVAELGLSVADEHQRCGIGSLLLESLVGEARSAKVVRVDAEVLASNHGALRFLFHWGFRSGGRPVCGVHRVFLPLESASSERSWAHSTVIEQIKRRAYELYLARGANAGRELDDWLAAEREVCAA